MKKLIILTFSIAFGLFSLNGCSTIEGAGKDLQGAGQVISQEAKDAKRS